jgi:hypothetical protein
MDTTGTATFGDAASFTLLAATAYCAAILWPEAFGPTYTDNAGK